MQEDVEKAHGDHKSLVAWESLLCLCHTGRGATRSVLSPSSVYLSTRYSQHFSSTLENKQDRRRRPITPHGDWLQGQFKPSIGQSFPKEEWFSFSFWLILLCWLEKLSNFWRNLQEWTHASETPYGLKLPGSVWVTSMETLGSISTPTLPRLLDSDWVISSLGPQVQDPLFEMLLFLSWAAGAYQS